MCDASPPRVRLGANINLPSLGGHIYDSFIRVTRLLRVSAPCSLERSSSRPVLGAHTYIHVCHDAFLSLGGHIYMRAMTHSYVCHGRSCRLVRTLAKFRLGHQIEVHIICIDCLHQMGSVSIRGKNAGYNIWGSVYPHNMCSVSTSCVMCLHHMGSVSKGEKSNPSPQRALSHDFLL